MGCSAPAVQTALAENCHREDCCPGIVAGGARSRGNQCAAADGAPRSFRRSGQCGGAGRTKILACTDGKRISPGSECRWLQCLVELWLHRDALMRGALDYRSRSAPGERKIGV